MKIKLELKDDDSDSTKDQESEKEQQIPTLRRLIWDIRNPKMYTPLD